MLYPLLKTVHVLSIIRWLGGMIFVHSFLRPALSTLAPPERLQLANAVLARFFAAVLWAEGSARVSPDVLPPTNVPLRVRNRHRP
jgi:uncharacterized membrane protein